MSYRYTIKAVLENLDEIKALVGTFPQTGNIPAVEIDLSLQKLRNVYELMLLLKTQHQTTIDNQQEMLTPEVETPPLQEVDTVKDRSEIPPEKPVKMEEPVELPVEMPVPEQKIKKEVQKSETLSDRFKSGETLHESFHQSRTAKEITFADNKPVTDIYKAIGINDRFSFIRELFENDATIFEHTIRIMNSADSYEQAYDHLKKNFKWDMESDTAVQFVELVRRKFI